MAGAQPIRLAGFISGGGRTLLNLLDAIDTGAVRAEFGLMVASRECIGIERLRVRGHDVRLAERSAYATDEVLHDTISTWLDDAGIDLVCLCGYLRWMRVDARYRNRVINIHPSLLPAFGGEGMYGMRVHEAVRASGVTETGCTVHFVDDEYDHGAVILQRRCDVRPDDTPADIAQRVFTEECIAYPEAIRLFIDGRIQVTPAGVEIAAPE
jgi:phosphoribosylglycinamide formyltransferase-1